jgi:transposase
MNNPAPRTKGEHNMFKAFIGIDVSKDWVDIHLNTKVHKVMQSNTELFVKTHRDEFQGALCIMESTGGYEINLARHLSDQGIAVHIAHPNQVVAFMKAKNRLAKTDAIDARLLSAFGAFLTLEQIRGPLSEQQYQLQHLGARLNQLKSLLHEEHCRGNHPNMTDSFLKETFDEVVHVIEKKIKDVQNVMLSLVQADKDLREKSEILQSMPGIGELCALNILADLPEIGELSKGQVASLVGVAPITQQSGKMQGQSHIRYGRGDLRKVLYMGALGACRYNPPMKAFYERLCAKGKPKKVGIIAVLRKMLITLNAMIKAKALWKNQEGERALI